MNKWKKVARLFDLELEEEFYIQEIEGLFKFTTEGVLEKVIDQWVNTGTVVLVSKLISGKYRVLKKPWKPKVKERYWMYSASGKEGAGMPTYWYGTSIDHANWKIGNCFKTKKEAEVEGPKLMEKIRKEFEEA